MIRSPHIFLLAVYLAFGLVFNVIFEGSALVWGNAWTWLWLLAWPAALAMVALKWLLIIVAVIIGVALVCSLWERAR